MIYLYIYILYILCISVCLYRPPLASLALVEEAQVAHLLALLDEGLVHVAVGVVEAIHEVLPYRGVKEYGLLPHEADLLAPPADVPQGPEPEI